MFAKSTLILAAALSLAALSGCVDGGPRYGGGYRTPGPVVIEREHRSPEYGRSDRDRRDYRDNRGERDRMAHHRGPDRRDDSSMRDRRERERWAEACRRDPRARECHDRTGGRRP